MGISGIIVLKGRLAKLSAITPHVFISYSHDSLAHRTRVWKFAKRLRDLGVDAIIDQYVPNPPQGFPQWMVERIEAADFVLLVCTAGYLKRLQRKEKVGFGHGVLWEASLIFQEIYDAGSLNTKFIPVLLEGGSRSHVPAPLRGVTSYDASTSQGFEKLYGRITGRSGWLTPPLGKLKTFPSGNPDESPAEVDEVAELLGHVLAADSIRSLERCLFEVEALIDREPHNTDAKLLKDQIEQAIRYERALAGERADGWRRTRISLASAGAALASLLAILLSLPRSTKDKIEKTASMIEEEVITIFRPIPFLPVVPTAPGLPLTGISVRTIPGSPSTRQPYYVVAQVEPVRRGVPLRITVSGTDGFRADVTIDTDRNGMVRLQIPGAEVPHVVDTIQVESPEGAARSSVSFERRQ